MPIGLKYLATRFRRPVLALRADADAFDTARSLVAEWEADHETFSDPQIWNPEPIRQHLVKWWKQRKRPGAPQLATTE